MQDAPELNLGLELYYLAFFDLSTCRPGGFSVTEIPWLAIKEYGVSHGMEGEQLEDLFYYIRAMDKVYIQHHVSKAEKRGSS